MARACFISDLHLFTRRSRGHHQWEAIRRAVATADHCILGGDIFDFKWSTFSTTRETVEASLGWLRELAAAGPHCRVHFLLGNHDHHGELTARLPELAGTLPNFDWDSYYLRLGEHGLPARRRRRSEDDGRITAAAPPTCVRHVRRA
jgi:DNA repair exonuclease SbcCD nuclease subunit